MLSLQCKQRLRAPGGGQRWTWCHAAARAKETEPPRPRPPSSASRRQQLVLLLGAAALGPVCSPASVVAAAAPAAEWSYFTGEGVCSTPQSPVDLPAVPATSSRASAPLGPVRFKYPRFVKATVLNTGAGTPQVNFPEGVLCQLGGESYELQQIRFHAPSEHSFGGQHAAMDAQLVHRNLATGELLVLAVQLQPGAPLANPCLQAALASTPAEPGAEVPLNKPLSLAQLLPKPRTADGRRPYASYVGTLTQPPCSRAGAVRWVVFLDPLRVQAGQVLQFMGSASGGRSLGLNAAPPQPLGGREVSYYLV